MGAEFQPNRANREISNSEKENFRLPDFPIGNRRENERLFFYSRLTGMVDLKKKVGLRVRAFRWKLKNLTVQALTIPIFIKENF